MYTYDYACTHTCLCCSISQHAVQQVLRQTPTTVYVSLLSMRAGAAPFAFPLSTFYGSKDRRVTAEMVEGWRSFTTGPFSCTPIEGNHLWPLDKHAKAIWLQGIVDELGAMSSPASQD